MMLKITKEEDGRGGSERKIKGSSALQEGGRLTHTSNTHTLDNTTQKKLQTSECECVSVEALAIH